MSDLIHLLEVPLQCHIGCTAEERVKAQELIADITVEADIRPAAQSDDIALTVNYVALLDVVEEIAAAREYALVETLVETMATQILDRFPVESLRILMRKPAALRHRGVGAAAVEIFRKRNG
jgi:7,8-dihydroneopterin aldolase/epimerase/oxygenase